MEFKFTHDYFAAACYDVNNDIVELNFDAILLCDKLTDDEKIRFMTWQIEHEVLHAAIYKLEGCDTCARFDKASWTIQDKKEFLEIINIAERMGYKYHNPCKHLEK